MSARVKKQEGGQRLSTETNESMEINEGGRRLESVCWVAEKAVLLGVLTWRVKRREGRRRWRGVWREVGAGKKNV